jgi:GDP-4-dehydro-6-deoxy-D-mannose reductase
MKKIFITGITGMIGSHLSDFLIDKGYEVAGLSRNTSHFRFANQVKYKHYVGDILDKKFLKDSIIDFKPDVIYHLAAQAFNGLSWQYEDTTYLTNVNGTRNLLEVIRDYFNRVKIIVAGSSAEYGKSADNYSQIPESATLNPISPYGVSKMVAEKMSLQFYYNYDIDVIIPRLFIHLGINHPPATAVQNIAKQLASLKPNSERKIVIGDVKPVRDFVDVRDGVKALSGLLVYGGDYRVFNVCSNKGYCIEDIVDFYRKIVNFDFVCESSFKYSRPSDEEYLVGDNDLINRKLGWDPKIEIKQTLTDIYNNWLERIQ